MVLSFYDTLSREKVDFCPLDVDKIRMYVCGPTVYDFAHIGNARPVVVFDVLYRLLRCIYPNVIYVRNITDIDDKINNRSAESGRSIREITNETTEVFQDDMKRIGALPPTFEPRATEHVTNMIEMIETLINKGHAYVADDHVLFDVSSMKDYGRLSGLNKTELIAGARVDVAPYKRDGTDFVLWKPSAKDTPGWKSPWGYGRPGWHIECSAMSHMYLGESFDIHAGGIDLVFPHHENEIAQTRCTFDTSSMASIWMHNGYVTVDGEKMSKSLGNFFTVHDLLKEWPGEVIRYALLAGHYRAPLDYSTQGLMDAKASLDRLYHALRGGGGDKISSNLSKPAKSVVAALSDDLNTPLALSRLHEIAKLINKTTNSKKMNKLKDELISSAYLLGLLVDDPETWFQGNNNVETAEIEEIEEMIAAREVARKKRDFIEADRIRDELKIRQIVLEDSIDGTVWRRH